ncbi:MAG: hypothetical protein CMI54_06110 [Parcubacteria group bacterium]|nr:hypothetical protein [Parcubacteria group bacterium]
MADATSTITVDTGEWTYVDSTGVRHAVTNGETFNLDISDDGAADVQYSVPIAQTVATDDGYVITFRPQITGGNLLLQVETLTDAGQGSAFVGRIGVGGEIPMSISTDNVVQNWVVATITPSDADYGSAGTIAATFEDQFGNTMSWASGMTVGQAA